MGGTAFSLTAGEDDVAVDGALALAAMLRFNVSGSSMSYGDFGGHVQCR